MSYLEKMRLMASNKDYLVVMATYGVSLGISNALMSQLQQLLCSRNYGNWLTSAVAAAFMLTGVVGGSAQAVMANRSGRVVEVGKVCFNVGLLFMVADLFLLRQYDKEAEII